MSASGFQIALLQCADGHVFKSRFRSQTLHGPLPIPGLNQLVGLTHEIPRTKYPEDEDGSVDNPLHEFHFHEQMVDFRLFHGGTPSGGLSLAACIPGLAANLKQVTTHVTFEGPALISFKVHTPFGTLRLLQTLLPVAPFTQHVESRWYAPRSAPTPFVLLIASVAAEALEQDRKVWENKMFRQKPMLVSGDGPFPAFRRWWARFYSESSDQLGRGDALDW